MKTDFTAPNIWDYLDFRLYLKDFYFRKKEKHPHFSYRLFSQKTGVQSPNYLKLIIDGERNLTRTHAKQVAKYCQLDNEQTSYFLALVFWEQSKDREEKDLFWKEVLRSRKDSSESKIQNWQLALLSSWHAIAILEMARLKDFRFDYDWILKRFRCAFSKKELKEAIATLVQAQLIEVKGEAIQRIEGTLKTSDDIPSSCVRKFHRDIIREASAAIELVPINVREYSSSTIGISNAEIAALKEEVRVFRNHILKTYGKGDSPDQVYQLNIQFFPLTQ